MSDDTGSNSNGDTSGEGSEGSEGNETRSVEERLDSIEKENATLRSQNKGLYTDLQAERDRRRDYAQSSLSEGALDKIQFTEEDKKKLQDSLQEEPVDTIVNLTRRVIYSEWTHFQAHQRCVTELYRKHPDMFDKEGVYQPNSEKGKVWEQIVAAHPELKGKTDSVRQARYLLEDQLGTRGISSKSAEDAKQEGAEEEAARRDRVDSAHVDDGSGSKPSPKTKSTLTPEEKVSAAKAKVSEKEYAQAKTSRVIVTDV